MTGFLDGQVQESGGYVIQNSLRFSAASSQYLSRTPAGAGDRRKFTVSVLGKVSQFGVASNPIISAIVSGSNVTELSFDSSNRLDFFSQNTSGTVIGRKTTNRVFRDPSSHYHILLVVDTTNATAADRIKLYVNGAEETSFAATTNFTLNDQTGINDTTAHRIGGRASGTFFFDGYLSEIHLIDGQALTPSSFGETNIETGEWVAKPYTGTYGTNGFYLDFSDGTSTTTLGYDAAGSNDWTLTNFTRSAGVNDCWMKDVPAGNGEASAVQPSGNYAVLNPLNKNTSVTVSRANLAFSNSNNRFITSSLAAKVGKHYAEFVPASSTSASVGFGVIKESDNVFGSASFSSAASFTGVGYLTSGQKSVSGTLTAYGAAMASNDVIGIAIDLDASPQTITFYRNNTSQGSINLPTNTDGWVFASDCSEAGTHNVNFGQRSFAYTPPTGFKALCTSNLPTPVIKRGDNHFTAKTRTGTGASFSVTGIRHAVDWLFGKSRSAATDWFSYDVNRGVQKQLEFNTTTAETTETTGLTAFNSDGYSGGALAQMNTNGATYIDYMMKAGGAPVSNTAGSITSQVSANVTAGFSVVTWTANASANQSIGHGLGKAPKLVIVKDRSGNLDWNVWFTGFTANEFLKLNTTDVKASFSTLWNLVPSSTLIYVGNTGTAVNFTSGNNYVAYCFAEIEGFSKFGSYTGNGSADGTFVYTGFKPRFVMIKRINTAGGFWYVIDTARDLNNNGSENQVYPNSANAEADTPILDILSNGFKLRSTDGGTNLNNETNIYWAIADIPLNYSNAR